MRMKGLRCPVRSHLASRGHRRPFASPLNTSGACGRRSLAVEL